MPETGSTNQHVHHFAILDENARELSDNATFADGVTTFAGVLGERHHKHDWFMHWDFDKKKYIVRFGPGGDDKHAHPDMELTTI